MLPKLKNKKKKSNSFSDYPHHFPRLLSHREAKKKKGVTPSASDLATAEFVQPRVYEKKESSCGSKGIYTHGTPRRVLIRSHCAWHCDDEGN